jgi:hypothetical protein
MFIKDIQLAVMSRTVGYTALSDVTSFCLYELFAVASRTVGYTALSGGNNWAENTSTLNDIFAVESRTIPYTA